MFCCIRMESQASIHYLSIEAKASTNICTSQLSQIEQRVPFCFYVCVCACLHSFVFGFLSVSGIGQVLRTDILLLYHSSLSSLDVSLSSDNNHTGTSEMADFSNSKTAASIYLSLDPQKSLEVGTMGKQLNVKNGRTLLRFGVNEIRDESRCWFEKIPTLKGSVHLLRAQLTP